MAVAGKPIVVTKSLRSHMEEHFGLKPDASEEIVRKQVGSAIVSGEMDLELLGKLTVEEANEGMIRVKSMMKEEFDAFEKRILGAIGGAGAATAAVPGDRRAEPPPASMGTKAMALAQATGGAAGVTGTDGAAADDAFFGEVKIKSVTDRYDDVRTAATYMYSNNMRLKQLWGPKQVATAEDGGRYLDMPTPRARAVAGAWMKYMIACEMKTKGEHIPRGFRLTEHDMDLVKYALHECKFVGPIEPDAHGDSHYDFHGEKLGDHYRKAFLGRLQTKAVLDDSTSGGLEAVPIEFDDLAIITPLLNGELFPLVTIRNVTRRRIEGFSVGNPTVTWSAAEGTEIALFNTDSLIAAFDTNVYPVTGAIEFGLDFEADAPVAIGDILVNRYGERFKQEMDNVIANGSGTDRPKGLFNTSGITTINSANGTGGPLTIGDFEGLLFGVKKQYRVEAGPARSVFLSTETSYQRARGIPVDTSADARRLFGLNEESYDCLGHPYKINESLTNSQIGFFCMNRYRMYRRAGYAVRIVTEDKELVRKNQRMIVVRARFGGQFELGTAGCVMTDAKS